LVVLSALNILVDHRLLLECSADSQESPLSLRSQINHDQELFRKTQQHSQRLDIFYPYSLCNTGDQYLRVEEVAGFEK
jgi:HSP20 family molecular chaperone IbpA